MKGLMMDYPLTLQHFLWRSTTLFPGREMSSRREGGGTHRQTYREFGERTARLAHALAEAGVSRGDRIGTFAWNNHRHLELYHAVPCMGAVLHTLNIRLAAQQLEYIVNDAEDRVIFVDQSLLGLLEPLAGRMPTVRLFVCMTDGEIPETSLRPIVSYEDFIAQHPAEFDWPRLEETDAAAICYTSGTTGDPKGVVYSHRSAYLHSMGVALPDAVNVSERDRILPVVPMFHANAWGLPYVATMTGAGLVFPDRFLDPASLAAVMQDERVTIAAGVPTIWIGLLAHLDQQDIQLPHLREITCGGSAVPAALIEGFARRGLTMVQGWGMTETSPVASLSWVKSHLEEGLSPEARVRLTAKQGVTLAGVEVRIVDSASGAELPWDGEAFGELQVRGPWIASAYHRDADPSKFEGGWLHTGDVATIDPEGYIEIVDRTKDVIKSGGEWVSSVQLENEIMAHPDVLEACVVGVSDEKWGERPLAFVVVRPGQQLDAGAVRRFLDGRVAKWWIPEDIRFIDEVPKTSVGKFDKKVLRARVQEEAAHPSPTPA
ncbi:MAG: long-chain fatty acid--CoA ligase [Candidatus Dormibacteria bacterium]